MPKLRRSEILSRIKSEGDAPVARQGLGEMPLTLWVIVAAIIVAAIILFWYRTERARRELVFQRLTEGQL